MKNRFKIIVFVVLISLFLVSCVDQSVGEKGQKNNGNLKVIACSVSTAEILDKLGVDLIGVPHSDVDAIPKRYQNLPEVGSAMSPDMEIIESLYPDYAFAPVSIISDLMPKFEAAGINYGFLNLNNVDGMYKSIADLGALLNKENEAKVLIDDYEKFMKEFKERIKGKQSKRVLILMGLPGSYVIATENSYAGSLAEMAGCENVYVGSDQQFLTVNTEDILSKEPDIIFRTAHAMPDDVMEMFKEDFEKNDIWKHFDAVAKGKVYDLDHNKFGMSANFNYKDALKDLEEILYE